MPSLQEEKVPDNRGSQPVPSPQPAPLLWGTGGTCVKLPLQLLCCLGGGVCLSHSNIPGLRGQGMSTSHHSGVSPSAPFRGGGWSEKHSGAPVIILEAQNQSLPSQEPPPRMQVVQLEMTGPEAQQSPSLQGPTPLPTLFFLTPVSPASAERSGHHHPRKQAL